MVTMPTGSFALITDTHWGVRGDSTIMLDYQKKFLKEEFFPKLKEKGITRIIHLGDLMDRRKYVNYHTLNRLRTDFLDVIRDNGMHMTIIAGNHDTYYKSTNDLNALSELLGAYSNWTDVIHEPCDDGWAVFMPWINPENSERALEMIAKSKAPYLFGHLELHGFEMFRGQVSEHGMESKPFKNYRRVFTGHFHQKSTQDNIHYLGAPWEMTWSDYACPRGFHIFTPETDELEFYENPNHLFCKVFYDDTDESTEEVVKSIEGFDFSGAYVKIIVENKTNPYAFDLFFDKIQSTGPSDIRIVEPLNQADNSEIVDQAEDTQTILMRTIEEIDYPVSKKKLKRLMSGLYTDALNVEVDA